MKRWAVLLFLVVSCVALAVPQASHAEKRAFVVGVNGYASLPKLTNATKDAAAVAKAFGGLGYSVVTVDDPVLATFEEKWREFLTSLNPGDVAAFYFAGHGLQIDGANYLLLKDSPGASAGEAVILEVAVNFHELMQRLEQRQLAASLYILDACRNNPISDTRVKANTGQARGLSRIESVFGAFIMYSAGPDEEALDYLRDPRKEANSVYASRLLPLVGSAELSLVDIAKRVQVQVEEDARSVSHKQRPAYFDGIVGQYYLAKLDQVGKPLGPGDRIAGDNVVRLGAFATWDSACQSRPAPRINVISAPKYGRIVTRYETFTAAANHFGNRCDKSTQRGVGVYYVIDEANKESTAIESLKIAVNHWSVAPTATVNETFDIDIATRYSKRIPGPAPTPTPAPAPKAKR